MQKDAIKLLKNAEYGTLALTDGSKPYAVALNFVYLYNAIYFHCSKKGKKIDLIKSNSNCFFSVIKDYSLIPSYFSLKSGLACPATHFFESLHIEGIAKVIDSIQEKQKMFTALMPKVAKQRWLQKL